MEVTDLCGSDGFTVTKFGAKKEWRLCGTDVLSWRVCGTEAFPAIKTKLNFNWL